MIRKAVIIGGLLLILTLALPILTQVWAIFTGAGGVFDTGYNVTDCATGNLTTVYLTPFEDGLWKLLPWLIAIGTIGFILAVMAGYFDPDRGNNGGNYGGYE